MASVDVVKALRESRNIAVVGLSPNIWRPSYDIANYLIRAGYNVIPVNPNYSEVLGRPCYASLREIKEPVDIVDVFRNSEFIGEIVEDALAIRAKLLWLQLGITNPVAVARAESAGLPVIQDQCIKVEHLRHRAEIMAG